MAGPQKKVLNNDDYVLALDVSSSTIGIALFKDNGDSGKLIYLKHVTPKLKPLPKNKLELLFKKAEVFETQFLDNLIKEGFNITKVVVEEPLLNSNNVYTVATLLRFNTLICAAVYNKLGIIPEFISSYDARAFSFPDLMQIRKTDKKGVPYPEKKLKGAKPVLFGGYPWTVDKKTVIFEKVSDREPLIDWIYNKNKTLAKENYDMSDAYAVGLGYMQKIGQWK